MKLTKSLAFDAITVLVHIGDHPDEQGMHSRPVRWSDTVLLGLGHNPRDFAEEARVRYRECAASRLARPSLHSI